MSDNTIDLVCDFKVETSLGSSPESLHSSLSGDHVRPKIIAPLEDSGSYWASRNSLKEETSSYVSLYALICNVGIRIHHTEVPIPHCILSEEEVHANLRMRECTRDFIQFCLQTIDCESSDAKVLEHLNFLNWLGASEYDWMDEKVTSISSALSTKVVLRDYDIMFGDSLEWSVILVSGEKRIRSSFDDCMILFYECMFTRVGLQQSFLNLRYPF